MSIPEPAPLPAGDPQPLSRMRFRLWLILTSAGSLLATAWCFTQSVFVGFLALFLTKHVLVAVLAAGLSFPRAADALPDEPDAPVAEDLPRDS